MNSQLTSICSPNPTQELLFKISFENYSSIKRNRMDNIPFLVSTTHICENLHDMICHSCKEVIDIAITQLNWIFFACSLSFPNSFCVCICSCISIISWIDLNNQAVTFILPQRISFVPSLWKYVFLLCFDPQKPPFCPTYLWFYYLENFM